jgi:flagellar basal body-associated protein FliL
MTQDDRQPGDSEFSASEEGGSGHRGDGSFLEDEQFTGNELDEEPEEVDQSIPREVNSQIAKRGYKGKWWLWPCIALSVCAAVGLGYLSLRWGKIDVKSHDVKENPQHRLPVPKDRLIHFHSLVIPFHGSKNFTYLSFSISFYVPNNKVREEIERREVHLRGIMYDMLTQEINQTREVPSLEILKEVIVQGINASLSSGSVREAYISRFLAV